VQAREVGDTSAGNRKVCVIDSGYYMAHADLQGANVTASPNSGTGDPYVDRCGHGTHVAGTIAALNNSEGVVGVVGNGALQLHIVKVFGDSCSWTYSSDLIAAATACEGANANVINMSLGGGVRSRFEEQKFDALYRAGVLSVAERPGRRGGCRGDLQQRVGRLRRDARQRQQQRDSGDFRQP